VLTEHASLGAVRAARLATRQAGRRAALHPLHRTRCLGTVRHPHINDVERSRPTHSEIFMSPINEVARAVVILPPDATIYSSPVYLAVAFDAYDGRAVPTLLTRGSTKSLGYLASYELIGYLLCGDRAQRAVDESLVVDGKPLTPEAYIALWRSAKDAALTPSEFTARYGASLIATIRGPVDRLSLCRSSWTSAPFPTFAESPYADSLKVVDGRFQLTLDLCQPNAARDAYDITEMVASACSDDADLWSAAIAIESGAASTSAQTDLFESAASEAGALA
jgi:hypothetical protein